MAADDAIERFVAQSPPIDDVREEAARCAHETARYERGERGPLRMPVGLLGGPIGGEFSDAAFGVAAEVAMVVAEAVRAAGQRFAPDFPWSMAADLLRRGWQRGHRLLAYQTGRSPAS